MKIIWIIHHFVPLFNNCVVFISGSDDFIIYEDNVTKISNGSSVMTKVTAIGCSLSCIVGAFAAVGESLYKSAISSAAIFSIAGELAASKSEGPGDFQVNFLNKLNNITEKEILDNLKITSV